MADELSTTNIGNRAGTIHNEMLEQFKSLFYLAKGKRDTQIRLYDDNKSFYRQDLIELNEKIQDKLSLHNVTNKVTNICFHLSKNKVKSFGNWQEFLNEKWETSDETDGIIITWDFEVVLPNRTHTLPQTHSLRVRIGNEVKPSEMIHLIVVGSDEFELEENSAQMVCKVDFVNATLAVELLDKVNEWYSSLTTKKSENATNIFINKHLRLIMLFTEIFIILSGLCLFFPIGQYILNQSQNLSTNSEYLRYNYYLVAGVFITFTIFTRIGSFYSRKIAMIVERLKGTVIFEITKGDKNLQQKILDRNKSLRREIYLKIIVSLISTGILYLAGTGLKLLFENLIK